MPAILFRDLLISRESAIPELGDWRLGSINRVVVLLTGRQSSDGGLVKPHPDRVTLGMLGKKFRDVYSY